MVNRARVLLNRVVPHVPQLLTCWHEVSYEDCLGAMLPKFYYPAEPREIEIRSPYGRPAGTKREPSYQIPQDAIEKVGVDDPEVAARWERLHEEQVRLAEICDAEALEGIFGDSEDEDPDGLMTPETRVETNGAASLTAEELGELYAKG